MKQAEMLVEKSINRNLCSHCGVCGGVCPTKAITIENNIINVEKDKCIDCGACLSCCPSNGYELSDLTLEDIKDIPKYSVAAKNTNVSKSASSGGFVTQALLSLLANGEITAAAIVVLGDDITESCAKYIVTDNPVLIMQARGSKYTQATIDGVIDYIKNNDGRYAVVGLPCQLYGLTQAMKRSTVLKKRIAYKFGMVCGYTYDEECIDGLMKVMGVERNKVKRILGWRENGLPGNFTLELKDGTSRSLPFADEHSVDVTYYAQNRCKLCRDCLCEEGDVVSADIGGWREKRTLVLARNSVGKQLISTLKKYDTMIFEECNVPFEKTVLPFMLREKRSKVDIRLKRQTANKPYWVGGYSPKLLVAQKIEAFLSHKYEKKALKGDKQNARDMLRIGHKAYHEMSSLLILKILFKLQVYWQKFVRIISSKYKQTLQKMKVVLGNIALLRSKKAVKVAVIGLGKWGAQYLGFLKSFSKFELVAAYDSDLDRLDFLCKKYNIHPARSLEELCTDFGAKAIFILTPTPTHFDVFNAVSKYRLPTYIEKPISNDEASAKSIIECAKRNESLLYVAHSMKYEPIIKKIKEMLKEGTLGEVVFFEVTRSVKRKNNDYYDNAALYQIGVHIIDIVLFLFGDIDSVLSRSIEVSELKNYENISLKTSGGCIGKLNYGFSNVYNFNLKIKTEKAVLTYADSVLTIYGESGKEQIKIPMINEKTVFEQLDEFYFAIKGQEYLNTPQNAMNVMRICDEIVKTGE